MEGYWRNEIEVELVIDWTWKLCNMAFEKIVSPDRVCRITESLRSGQGFVDQIFTLRQIEETGCMQALLIWRMFMIIVNICGSC